MVGFFHQFHKRELEEVEQHRFVTEASAIGIKPGMVPQVIAPYEMLGNGEPFVLVRDDLESFVYHQNLGCISIEVFND